jgi:ABC-type transport system involved in cytochrome c biogenesis permease subunit
MIMIDQSRRLAEPLRWGRREKLAVAVALAVVALAAVGLGAYALTSGAPARSNCIEVTFASTVGGATVHACAARARAICATPGPYGGIADLLRQACQHARLPFARGVSP